MKLWKISQSINNGYDTFDSAIVVAPDEETAQNTHPSGNNAHFETRNDTWVSSHQIDHVTVEYIGEAKQGTQEGVILASFNAG